MRRRGEHILIVVTVAADAVMAAAAWMGCYYFRFRLGLFAHIEALPPGPQQFGRLLPIVVLCDLAALTLCGAYAVRRLRSPLQEWMPRIQAAALGWMGMLCLLYFLRATPYSRLMLLFFFFANILALLFSRAMMRAVMRRVFRRGVGTRRAAILGTDRLARQMLHRIRSDSSLGLSVEYLIDHEDAPTATEVEGVPVLAGMDGMLDCLQRRPVDELFLAVPNRRAEKLDRALVPLLKLPIDSSVVLDLSGAGTPPDSNADQDELHVVPVRDRPIEGWKAALKRGMDVVGALALLAVCAGPMLILAALVKLTSRGPALYRQERMGLGGRSFVMLKFRSMRAEAERETGPVLAGPGDPRRTRVGALMRRTSLDELPQLFNVLFGDMSLVGPRPERPVFVRQFTRDIPAYMLRNRVKAGLTGWAQVNGLRGRTSLRRRLQYDLYYINNWSPMFDLFILLVTPFSGLASRHAY